MMRRVGWMYVALVLGAAACGDHQFEPPDPSVRVARAESNFSVALFDSLQWDADSVRTLEGNEVYAERCRRCHGQLGRGETDYAHERDLTVPSLVTPAWPLAELDSLRHRIFVGHQAGMPVFGDGELSPRQIDATAAYILLVLRPEVLGED